MRIDIIAKILEQKGVGTRATTIFVHHMPSNCLQGVLIKAPLTGMALDHNLPGYIKDEFQVIVRSQDQAAGEALARQVMQALTIKQTEDHFDPGPVFAMRINYSLPQTLPIRYPRSDGNGIEWSINFDIVCVIPL